jgi:mannose-6-phosphate isomerase class I
MSIASLLPREGLVACDGYAGVFWDDFREGLSRALELRGQRALWVDVSTVYASEEAVRRLVEPFLGGDDPLFGRRFTGSVSDFLDLDRARALPGAQPGMLTIHYGCGAALTAPGACLVYVDLPKNEIQFRSRAGLPINLAHRPALPPKAAYKRAYFVDWPALNGHKKSIAARVDLLIDAQRPDDPVGISGPDFRAALSDLATHGIRPRPWFEPGPWGGQWCARHIRALPEAPNYAWSFELIAPENGVLLSDGHLLLEASFDWLMFSHATGILGPGHGRFGDEFPIRFDFLDTVDGGNLSVQVHPSPDYIGREFGERFTQDETYYILDAVPGARVNLGFQAGADAEAFRASLEKSQRDATPVDIGRFVQSHPAHPHDLFLIPHGAVHGAGAGTLVLEISATPYIFTFKLYDWLRADLDGKPRPLNLARGFENLRFEWQGDRVREELVSRPRITRCGGDWQEEHLPTHRLHFYDVHRWTFASQFESGPRSSVHVLSLVSGHRVRLETREGGRQAFHFAETFIVPESAGPYRLVNEGPAPARVVVASLKPPSSGN